MKSRSDNEDTQISVSSNNAAFAFDDINMCSNNPYVVYKESELLTAIFIEHIRFNNEMLFIEGWAYGFPLTVNNLQDDDYIIKRFKRDDVSEELDISSYDAGFTIQLNITNYQIVNISHGDINIDILIKNRIVENKEPISGLKPGSDELLIVGGAPSIALHIDEIKAHKGDVWALNDAVFWLNDNNISVDRLVVADQRFIDKQHHRLALLKRSAVIAADYINFSLLPDSLFNIFRVKNNTLSIKFYI
jgi:hypothetical protein